jgi:hypothetical protein
MKKMALAIAVGFVMTACNNTGNKTEQTAPADTSPDSAIAQKPLIDYSDTANLTTIEWIDKENQVLPKIKAGETIEITYRFKNTGSKPLVIKDVSAGCGCTIPEKPQEPILPGKQGVIKAKFNSTGRQGTQQKNITVISNAKAGDIVLTFSVDVE